MNFFCARRWRLSVSISLVANVPLHAGQTVVELQPQWLETMSHEQLVYDQIATSSEPAALRLPDGGEVTVTATDHEIVLRRYANDGDVVQSRAATIEYGRFDVVLRAAPAYDAFYVLAGGAHSEAQLLRFDGDLTPAWSLRLPDASTCPHEGACLRLEVLEDGSAVATRAFLAMRVGSDGEIRWSRAVGSRAHFSGSDLAVAADTIWFATSGSDASDESSATLTRLDFDGAPLSSEVSSCQGCGGVELTDLDASGDGDVFAAGNRGGRGFLQRYDVSGNPLSWSASDEAYSYWRLGRDGDGATYVLASTMVDGFIVKRVDADSGATLWSVPADDFVARQAGVATIRRTPSGVEAAAFDATGAPRWDQPLTVSDGGGFPVWSRPAYVGDEVELLVRDLASSDDPCATYPQLVRIDDAGATTRFPLPCRSVPQSVEIGGLDARPGIGVLANTLAQLVALTPNGDQRWQVEACPWCSGYWGASVWLAATLSTDGGAWAVRWDRPSLALPDGQTRIQRMDANGTSIFDVASTAAAASNAQFRVLPGADDAVVLRGGGARVLTWQRIGEDGSDRGSQRHAIPDDSYLLRGAHRLPDGGTSALTEGYGYCGVGCPPFYTTVLRLAADGTLLWRYQFPELYAPELTVALAADGRAAAVLPSTPYTDGALRMRTIDADGNVGDDVSLTGVDLYVSSVHLLAAPDGRWLLTTYADDGHMSYWLLDDSGHVRTEHRNGPFAYLLQATAAGFLASEPIGADSLGAVVLDPVTLAASARPYNGSGAGPNRWVLLDDGSLYGAISLPQRGSQAVARFSMPGATPSDVIFRYGMD
jgi:hypothetical protein